MPVTGITGLPGHGKSYGTVKHIIEPALKAGRHVSTNIPMTDNAHNLYPEQITQLDLDSFDADNYKYGSVVVLDEFWRLCASGTRTNNIEQSFKAFFAEHRHHVGDDGKTTEIVLVTQDFSQVCSYVKSLIETTYRVRKIKAGKKQYCRTDIYDGMAQGNPPKGSPVNTLTDNYEQSIFDLYKSHMYSKGGDNAGIESDVDDRRSMFRHPMIRFGLPFAVVFLFFGIYFAYRSITGLVDDSAANVDTLSDTVIPAPAVVPVPVPAPAPAPVSPPLPRKDYRYGLTDDAVDVPYRLTGWSDWAGLHPDSTFIVNSEGYGFTLRVPVEVDLSGIRFVMFEGFKVTQYTGKLSWSASGRESVRVTESDYSKY